MICIMICDRLIDEKYVDRNELNSNVLVDRFCFRYNE